MMNIPDLRNHPQARRYARQQRSASLVMAALVMMLVSGCGTYHAVRETPVADLIKVSEPLAAGEYLIEIGDVLTVRFYYHPELDHDVQVRADGRISLALIGEVTAENKDTGRLSTEISSAYKAYVNQPDATVILKSPAGHRVFVTGEVLLPGVFVLQGTETALSALSLSGGLTDRASYRKVVLIRRLPNRTTPLVAVLDLRAALNGKDPRQDVHIMMNDIVYVPRVGSAQADVVLKNLIWGKAPFSTTAGAVWNGTIK